MTESQGNKFKTSLWNAFLVAGTTASIVGVGLWFFEKVTSGKSLQVTLNSSFSLLNSSFPRSEELEIHFDGEAINNAIIYSLTIENNGSNSIGSNDFEEKPLTISFSEVEKIFSPEIVNSSPDSLVNDVDFETKENILKLEPLLLNSGDAIYIEVTGVTSNYDIQSQKIECYGRIRGVKEISCLNDPEDVFFPQDALTIIGAIFSFAGSILTLFYGKLFEWWIKSKRQKQKNKNFTPLDKFLIDRGYSTNLKQGLKITPAPKGSGRSDVSINHDRQDFDSPSKTDA